MISTTKNNDKRKKFTRGIYWNNTTLQSEQVMIERNNGMLEGFKSKRRKTELRPLRLI